MMRCHVSGTLNPKVCLEARLYEIEQPCSVLQFLKLHLWMEA